MALGPVQLLVIGFDDPRFDGSVLAALARLRAVDAVRLLDLVVVRKDAEGRVERWRRDDLPDAPLEVPGALGALIGLAVEEPTSAAMLGGPPPADALDGAATWYVDDAIPSGTTAALALLEHRWAIELRDALAAAGGYHLTDAWVHPADLAAIGMPAGEEDPS